MKISAFCVVTDPEKRQDPWRESIASVLNWADEVIIVCGKPEVDIPLITQAFPNENKLLLYPQIWPEDFGWEELPKHLTEGLRQCTGNWAIRFDIDYIFPEDWKDKIKKELATYSGTLKRAVTFQKFSIITVDKSYQKGPTIMGINRDYKDMAFGVDDKNYTDLCVPIVRNSIKEGVYHGRGLTDEEIGRMHLDFYNYDYTFKTEEFTRAEFFRFSKAHKKFFGATSWGEDENEALEKFINMMVSRNSKDGIYNMPHEKHPVFIREKVKNIREDQFGFNGWGRLK